MEGKCFNCLLEAYTQPFNGCGHTRVCCHCWFDFKENFSFPSEEVFKSLPWPATPCNNPFPGQRVCYCSEDYCRVLPYNKMYDEEMRELACKTPDRRTGLRLC